MDEKQSPGRGWQKDVPSRGLSAGLPASDNLVTGVWGVLGTMREHRGGPRDRELSSLGFQGVLVPGIMLICGLQLSRAPFPLGQHLLSGSL